MRTAHAHCTLHARIQNVPDRALDMDLVGLEYAKEGYLLKRSAKNVAAPWQPRYFAARGRHLSYFETFAKDNCLGRVDLKQVGEGWGGGGAEHQGLWFAGFV